MDELARLRQDVTELRAELNRVRQLASASATRRKRVNPAVLVAAISLAVAPIAMDAAVPPVKPTYVTTEQVNNLIVSIMHGAREIASRDRFEVKKDDGTVLFRVDDKGLEWRGAGAKALLRVDMQGGVGHLLLSDGEGHARADLGAGVKGNTALRISNRNNVQVAGLGEDPDTGNSGALKIHTGQGEIVAGVTANNGHGFVSVFDPANGKGIAEMGSDSGGRAYVSVFNASGISVASLALSEKIANVGRVTVNDASGNGVFSAGWVGDEAAACLNGKGGRLWCLGKNVPLGR